MATLLTGDAGQRLFMDFSNEMMDEARVVLEKGDDQPYVEFLLDFAEEILEYRSMSLTLQRAQLPLAFQKLTSF